MATTFKTLTANDITNTRTLLHEAIPLTGTITSGTYSDNNIKTYSHGMFTSVFDYPYLSSSANHIFDIAVGYASGREDGPPGSALSSSDDTAAGASPQQAKKCNIYNQMAQVLMGHDVTGGIQHFDQDGDLSAGGTKMNEVFFLNFARLLSKDEIKKGSFSLTLVTGGQGDLYDMVNHGAGFSNMTLGDYGAATSYYSNSPAGEYGLLFTSSADADPSSAYGLLFYQAGIAVVSGAVFNNPQFDGDHGSGTPGTMTSGAEGTNLTWLGNGAGSGSFNQLLTGAGVTMDYLNTSIRGRIQNVSFNNTVELNSTVYFCRANHNEFNYSANPTYLSSSQIRVKNTTSDNPVSYITTVGLYSSDNELLAVAKVSEPLKKDPNTELTLRVRLDY